MKTMLALASVGIALLTMTPQDANAQRRAGYRSGGVAVRAAVVRPRVATYRSYAAYRPAVVRARRAAYYSYAAYRPRYRSAYYSYAAYRPLYRSAYYSYAAYRPYYTSYASYRPYYSSYASYQTVAVGPRRSCTIYPSGFRWCWTYF